MISNVCRVAGTLQSAELKPDIPSSRFPKDTGENLASGLKISFLQHVANTSRRRLSATEGSHPTNDPLEYSDAFSDEVLRDADFLAAAGKQTILDLTTYLSTRIEDTEFIPIDKVQARPVSKTKKHASQTSSELNLSRNEYVESRQLENGKWACNHNCKDKTK